MIKIISWNLLRLVGASLDDVVRLVRHEHPDLLLMQETTERIDRLPEIVGGWYERILQPGRVHGLAYWSRVALPAARVIDLQRGAMFRRVSQVIDVGPFSVANVHLSHGQVLNRRQLRRVAMYLPARAAVLGDYNLVGPCLLPGFRDVGPREHTHRSMDMVPLRLDRCLVRGLVCGAVQALHTGTSDHRPIVVRLGTPEMRLTLSRQRQA
jgi:endonuclease/exonuclease/phosphatase family metal-dependent hydrolase